MKPFPGNYSQTAKVSYIDKFVDHAVLNESLLIILSLIKNISFIFSRSYSSDVPEYLIILFGVSWMSDTANALHDADHEKDEKLLRENQTLEEFFTNIYNFLNGDM